MNEKKEVYNIPIDFNINGLEVLEDLKSPNEFINFISDYVNKISMNIKEIEERKTNLLKSHFDYLSKAKESMNGVLQLLNEVSDKVTFNIKEEVFRDLEEMSKLGWCFLGIDFFNEVDIIYGDLTLTNMLINGVSAEMSIKEKNEYICNTLLNDKFEGKFEDIFEWIKELLDEKDRQKLNIAIEDYQNGRWFSCANSLIQIIDSLSIKQEIVGIKNRDLDSYLLTNPNLVSKQCWISFFRVFLSYFVPIICTENLTKEEKNKMKERDIKIIVQNCKDNFQTLDVVKVLPILNLLACMITFFEDVSWENYTVDKPISINRHWLAHGMYNVDDIEKYDCIKLFLILYQLVSVYDRLNNETL